MSLDEAAVIVSSVRDPRYRADCIEWFHDSTHDAILQFRGPREVYEALEQAAERAGRRFNDQLVHVLRACRGGQSLDFADARSLNEWRGLMGRMDMQFHEGEEWIPCSVMFPSTGR